VKILEWLKGAAGLDHERPASIHAEDDRQRREQISQDNLNQALGRIDSVTKSILLSEVEKLQKAIQR
jgi:hypothetical protein